MADIDIIIPTFNNEDFTLRCLESIKKYSNHQNYRVIWVDNGSTRPMPVIEYLMQGEIPFVHLMLPENLGFVKATNAGLAISTAPYVVLMNNDTEAVEGWLDQMLYVMENAPDAGLVGPLCSIADSWQNIDRCREMWKLDLPIPGFAVVPHMVAFFCTMIRREVIRKVGYLCEEFGLGFGDDDWYCELARRKGFKIYVALNVVIPHHHRTTFRSMFAREQIKIMQDKALATYHRKCRDEQ